MPEPTTLPGRGSDHAPNLGLGARIAVLFAVGGLLVSVGIASATLALTRRQLVEAREETATAVAVSNATRLSNQLTPESTIEDLPTVADSLTKVEGGQRIIRLGDDWLPAEATAARSRPAMTGLPGLFVAGIPAHSRPGADPLAGVSRDAAVIARTIADRP